MLALVATNQAGIARGYYTEEDMHALHEWMQRELRAVGGNIDGYTRTMTTTIATTRLGSEITMSVKRINTLSKTPPM